MIMGHSKHELSTKKPVLLPKKNITSLPPHNGHLSTTATFFCPQGGRYGDSSTKTRNPESGNGNRIHNQILMIEN